MKRRHSRKKNSVKIFLAASLVAAGIFGASIYFINKSNETVVATVNGQKILKSDIEAKLHEVFEGQNQEIKTPEIEKLPTEVVEILAKEIYLEKELNKEAKKSKATHTKEVNNLIENAKNRILRQAYIDSLIKEEVTDQKISEKYAEINNEIVGKKEYSVSHIVVKTKAEAEKIAQELKSKKGSKFSDLAKKYSIDQNSAENGGNLGYIVETNMIKEIADAIITLKKDEVSNPIQTKFGWHLVKISDSREAKNPPFESVKDSIRDQMIQDKISEVNSKITKDLKVKILIQPKEVEEKKPEQDDSVPKLSDTTEPEKAPEANAEEGSEIKEESANKAEEISEEKTEPKAEKEVEKTKEEVSEKKEKSKSNEKNKKHKSKKASR